MKAARPQISRACRHSTPCRKLSRTKATAVGALCRQRCFRSIGYQAALLLGQGCVEMQHEWVGVAAPFGHDERHTCAIKPDANATSRESRSSLETRILPLALRAADM
jgi:hypothetical protein